MSCQLNQDLFTLLPSVARAEATYTAELPICRGHRGVRVYISNTAETGTSTLDAKLQYKNPQSLAWTDIPGASFVQFADGATGERFIEMYVGATGSDADSSLALATNFKQLGLFPHRYMRLSCTVGGTTVTRTFSAGGSFLP